MITEDYVSFEVAKLLKEKGFNESIKTCYHKNKFWEYSCNKTYNGDVFKFEENEYSAPTQSLVMRWLRETYKLHIEVEVLKPYVLDDTKKRTVPSDRVEFHASIIFTDQWNDALEEFKNTGVGWHNTYEKAVEAALKYCLTNLI